MLQPWSVGRSSLAAIAVAPVLSFSLGPDDTGVLAIGDFGVGGSTQRSMGAAVRTWEESHPADVLLTLGDNDYTESPAAFHDNWTSSFGWLESAGVIVSGTLGNHDVRVDGGRYEFDELGMPRARYRRSIGDIDFFLLNSNSASSGKQRDWLRTKLAESTAPWQIVAFHHPAYTCGGYLGNSAVLSRWVPLFERYGVDLVLSGHDHNYQRFKEYRGVRYVVHGGGGAPLYSIRRCPASYPRRRFASSRHGFLYLVASPDAIRGYAVRPSGTVIDTFRVAP
jgi:3',5'-cyclic AMP phosphodiesterase CpdA